MRFVYNDSLLPLHQVGKPKVNRASNVEPDGKGGWIADIINGPRLGPFKTRQKALDAEVEYIEKHIL